jgi:hypothetical protein
LQLAQLDLGEICHVPDAPGYLKFGSAGWLFLLANVKPLDIVFGCSAPCNRGHASRNIRRGLVASETPNLTGVFGPVALLPLSRRARQFVTRSIAELRALRSGSSSD